MIALLHRRPARVLGAAVGLPLVLAAMVLLWRPWVPVLDMAMTELRVRDVGGRHTPLVGLPGRIGTFPDQGSHPGPWSFYLIAPFYRLAWSTAWGMELASVVINAVVGVAVVAIGARHAGFRGAVVFAAIVALAIRGYGLNVLTHPWNPYFPVLIWLLAAVAAWSVLVGDRWLALVVVGASTIAAQTHVPYLASAVALGVLVLAGLLWQWWRHDPAGEGSAWAPVAATLGLAALLWLPPLVEQVREPRGNIAKLVDHFATDQPEPSIGAGAAAELVTQHLDVFALTVDLIRRDDAFVHRAGQAGSLSVVGAIVLVVWAVAAVVALRRRHARLVALHGVAATLLLAGWLSITRVFGKVWFYLTLWMSTATLLVVLAIAWTGVVVWRERSAGSSDERAIVAAAAAVAAAATLLSTIAAVGHDVPEDDLAEDVRVVMPTVEAALLAGLGDATGTAGSYVVFWQESVVPGAQGYALLNELERRGFRVGVHPTWRVPATEHRVRLPGEFTAEVHMVSGAWIDEWRTRAGYVEVIEYDDRTDAERDRFDDLERRVFERLDELGRSDLVPVVETNLFGASLDPALPADVVDDLAEMILLGEPVAVFIAPAGSTQ